MLQPQLIELLLEKLGEYACDAEHGAADRRISENIPRLILNQIRWLDRLVDGDTFVGNLMAMLDSLSPDLQVRSRQPQHTSLLKRPC